VFDDGTNSHHQWYRVTWVLSITNGVVAEGRDGAFELSGHVIIDISELILLNCIPNPMIASPRYFETLLPLELSDPIQTFFNRGQG
jgi:hypothetical protein